MITSLLQASSLFDKPTYAVSTAIVYSRWNERKEGGHTSFIVSISGGSKWGRGVICDLSRRETVYRHERCRERQSNRSERPSETPSCGGRDTARMAPTSCTRMLGWQFPEISRNVIPGSRGRGPLDEATPDSSLMTRNTARWQTLNAWPRCLYHTSYIPSMATARFSTREFHHLIYSRKAWNQSLFLCKHHAGGSPYHLRRWRKSDSSLYTYTALKAMLCNSTSRSRPEEIAKRKMEDAKLHYHWIWIDRLSGCFPHSPQ